MEARRIYSRARSTVDSPKVEVVDLRREDRTPLKSPAGRGHPEAIGCQAGVLLFLNRKGYAGALVCRDCGKCPAVQPVLSRSRFRGRKTYYFVIIAVTNAVQTSALHAGVLVCSQSGKARNGSKKKQNDGFLAGCCESTEKRCEGRSKPIDLDTRSTARVGCAHRDPISLEA